MKPLKTLLLLLAVLAALSSCRSGKEHAFAKSSIQKRKYLPGYHVSLFPRHTRPEVQALHEPTAPVSQAKEETTASVQPCQDMSQVEYREPLLSASIAKEGMIAAEVFTMANASKPTLIRPLEYKNESPPTPGIIKKDDPKMQNGQGDDMLIICIIFAILLPPLGIYLYEGSITINFWVDLLLAVLGLASFGFFWGGALFYMAAIVFALVVILAGVSL